MDRDTLLLSAILCILSLGALMIGINLFINARRKAALAAVPQDDLRRFLRAAPPMQLSQTEVKHIDEDPPAPHNFIFRRHVSRDFASMEISHKRFRPAPENAVTRPVPLDILTIRSEVRAVLEAAAPAAPQPPAPEAKLLWTEADRLAVLSLAGASPASGLALLRRHGIGTLIAATGHPFRLGETGIEILPLPDGAKATAPLAAQLRAKLAQGERIAFHTETGLSGAAALLATRFSNRQPSQI